MAESTDRGRQLASSARARRALEWTALAILGPALFRAAPLLVRITAPATRPLPSATPYRVWYEHYEYWGYGGESLYLGDLEPNGTLVVDLPASNLWGGDPYWYRFYLADLARTCRADDPNPSQGGFTIAQGDTLEVAFAVACSP